MDTTASAPASLAPSHPRACLSILPPEVKILIVIAVAEIGHLEWWQLAGDSTIASARRSESPVGARKFNWAVDRTPMRALSMVSREFAELAEPYLWGSVNLATVPEEHLRHVLAKVLPRHRRHIKSLNLTRVVEEGYDERYQGYDRDDPYAETIEEATFPAPHFRLLTRAIDTLPALCKISCTVTQLWEAIVEPSSAAEGHRVRGTTVAAALRDVGSRLVDLSIFTAGEALQVDARWLASFLSTFPSLSHLRLSLPVRIGVQGRKSLVSTLSSLRHLAHLDIDQAGLVGHAFATAPWTCPLETLSLPDSLQYPSLFALLGKFQGSLKSLTITPVDNFNLHTLYPGNGQPFPVPHLHTLILSTRHQPSFLAAFSSCSLQYLTIHDVPHARDDDWRALIHTHAKSLKCVTIGQITRTIYGGSVSAIQRVCDANGIKCKLETIPADTRYPLSEYGESDESGEEWGSGEGREEWDYY